MLTWKMLLKEPWWQTFLLRERYVSYHYESQITYNYYSGNVDEISFLMLIFIEVYFLQVKIIFIIILFYIYLMLTGLF